MSHWSRRPVPLILSSRLPVAAQAVYRDRSDRVAVLQHGISRCDADIVIVGACGERAGEVVETIEEFPHLPDPKHGGTLIDRTVIICNTSSMPVAAREASIYTGLTLGEYYRQMGYNVLLLADPTHAGRRQCVKRRTVWKRSAVKKASQRTWTRLSRAFTSAVVWLTTKTVLTAH